MTTRHLLMAALFIAVVCGCAQVREDKHIPFPDSAALVDQAPETDDGYIVVPDIAHEELD